MDLGLLLASLVFGAVFSVGFIVFYAGFFVPLMVRARSHQNASPTFRIVNEDMQLPVDARSHFECVSADLVSLGFDEVATLLIPDAMTDMTSCTRLFVNRSTKETAEAASFHMAAAGKPSILGQCVDFTTWYQDDTFITTVNMPTVAGPPAPARGMKIYVPWLYDITSLYHAHRCITRWRSPVKTKTVRLDDVHEGDVVASYKAEWSEFFEDSISVGHYRYTEVNDDAGVRTNDDNPYASPRTSISMRGRYTLTIKGAYLMTWKLLWPIKPLYKAFVVRKGKRLLAQAGFSAAHGER
jgi:hypothetical protein